MKFLLIPRTTIDENFSTAAESAFSALSGFRPDERTTVNAYRAEVGNSEHEVVVIASRPERLLDGPVLVYPHPIPALFTAADLNAVEFRRRLLHGVVRVARDIWALERTGGTDFDRQGVFYRRPYKLSEPLEHQTAVLVDRRVFVEHKCPRSQHDLVLVAFGRETENLPKVQELAASAAVDFAPTLEAIDEIVHELNPDSIRPLFRNPVPIPAVTTLPVVTQPSWLSYEQWMHRLVATPQGEFIQSGVTGPQRVDGPAGSGKTLSLVLKSLRLLKEARAAGRQHHTALVLFSEETKRRVIESFLAPLDEDGFYLSDRNSGAAQSLTVTTLLEWSRSDLRGIVGTFELSSESAALARRDQLDLVRDALSAHIPGLLKRVGTTLSHPFRELLDRRGLDDIVARMFAHEFGVVIKGMADGLLRRYLNISRPRIALPIGSESDRRLAYHLFERYQETLESLGIVDLDDVAISHIKLLQMPLRREARNRVAFDSVFVDEAHSFNPNELAIFFLLTRRSELPPLVIAVDLPQGGGDKSYEEAGIDAALLRDVEVAEHVGLERFDLRDVHRCAQPILDLATSIFSKGRGFFSPVRVPGALRSSRNGGEMPVLVGFATKSAMFEGVLPAAERLRDQLSCARSDVLIVVFEEKFATSLPASLRAKSVVLRTRADVESLHKASRSNHYVIARPEQVLGLEFEGVLLVGVSQGEVPRLDLANELGSGAAAIFETQRSVELLYISLTRARRAAMLLYAGKPSELIDTSLVVTG